MSRRTRLMASAWLALAAPAAWAQQPPAEAAAPAPARGAVSVLVRQAERWLAQDRHDLAASSIERALGAEPRNPEALALAARIEAARDNRSAAAGYLVRLREVGGSETLRSVATEAVRTSTLDRAGLEEARRLSREGRADAAVARYRAVFGGASPPAAYALEYYQTLAGTAAGADEASSAMASMAARPDADARTRLAHAQGLTFRASSRQEGVRRLADLAALPEVAGDATRAWRQALLWSANDPRFGPETDAYLARFPRDTELAGRRAAAAQAAPAADPVATARQQGFTRLEAGALGDSARQFETALAASPADADALGGLGLVRLREGKLADARELLQRAVAGNPAGATQWQRALDGASYGLDLAEARRRLRANDLEGADAAARQAAQRSVEDRTDAEQLLGEVVLRRGDAASAEQRFRAVLARRPGYGPAQAGLTSALRAQGRLPPAPAAAAGAPAQAANGEVARLRAAAAGSSDPGVAVALLTTAMAEAPADPWLRLDLARAMRRQGRGAEARQLVEELAVRSGEADPVFAAALLAEEDDRQADADAFLNRIPPGRRTPDMARMQARVRTRAEVTRAAALLGSPQGRDRLLALAARPDPTGATAAAVVRAFADAEDRYGAAEAARVAQAVNRTANPAATLAVAGALLRAGLETEATTLAAQAEQGNPSADQRRDIAALRVGLAVRAADRLNEDGNQGQAFERLRPVLESDPGNVEARLALARLHQGARQPAEALHVAELLLGREPRNLEARRAAVDAAIAMGDRARAEALVAEAQRLAPRDARATFLAAQVARAFNNTARARTLYAQAAGQRQAETGGGASQPGGAALLENPFSRSGLASLPGGVTPDRLSREIAEARATLDQAEAPQISASVALRTRSGSPGLDRLQEVSVPVEARLPMPGGMQGTITARVTPVTLETGTLLAGGSGMTHFGTNALGTPVAPRTSAAMGVSAGLAYRLGDRFQIDIGSSPAGFPQIRALGGVEVALPLTDTLRLRVFGERRSVTDSLLSWAGMTDGRTGRYWGGVTQLGGRAQLERSVGQGYVYAGGGYYLLDGTNVQSNSRMEANAGIGMPIWQRDGSSLTSGLDLVWFSYQRNLRNFTFGNGGYFSPQSYTALNVPVDYRGRIGDFRYKVGATLGYAFWHESGARAFPNDPAAQRQAEQAALTNQDVVANFPGHSRGGVVASARAEGEYPLTPTLTLGASARYDKAANWDEMRVMMRLNNRF